MAVVGSHLPVFYVLLFVEESVGASERQNDFAPRIGRRERKHKNSIYFIIYLFILFTVINTVPVNTGLTDQQRFVPLDDEG